MKILKISAMLIFCIGIASSVYAYSLYGGKQAGFPVSYYTSSAFSSNVSSGGDRWYSPTAGKVRFNRQYNQNYANGEVYDVNLGYMNANRAIVYLYPNPYQGIYTWYEMRIFTTNFNALSNEDRTRAIAHEFGHVIGLNHSNSNNCNLMHSDNLCTTGPISDDVNGVNALYP